MLLHPPSLDVLRHELRRRICTKCAARPCQSEILGPEVVRPCEIDCPIFVHLPRLRRAAMCLDPMLTDRDRMLGAQVEEFCPADKWSPSGTASTDLLPREWCPLRRYRAETAKVILDLVTE